MWPSGLWGGVELDEPTYVANPDVVVQRSPSD